MPFIIGNRTVRIPVEGDNRVDEIPDVLVIRMEDMGTILVHVNAFNIFTINIPTELGTLVDDKAFLPVFMSEISEGRTEEAGTDDEVIVVKHGYYPLILLMKPVMHAALL